MFSLEGKVAIVTGASGTVGRAISISLATAGANLVLNYFSNEAGVKETQKLVEKLGAETVLSHGDVGDAQTAQKSVDEALATTGTVGASIGDSPMAMRRPVAAGAIRRL